MAIVNDHGSLLWQVFKGHFLDDATVSGFNLTQFSDRELKYLYRVESVPHELPISHMINSRGQVYAWGANASGQLGLDNDDNDHPIPALITSSGNQRVIQVMDNNIECGGGYSLFLTDKNRVYFSGFVSRSQYANQPEPLIENDGIEDEDSSNVSRKG